MADQCLSHDRRGLLRRQDDRRQVRKDRELEAARRISEALFEHLTLDELIGRALRTALEVVQAECGSILIADPASQNWDRYSLGSGNRGNRLSDRKAFNYLRRQTGRSPSCCNR